jgi:hypothetical protein
MSSLLLACEKDSKGNSCFWPPNELFAVFECRHKKKKIIWKMAQSEKAQ